MTALDHIDQTIEVETKRDNPNLILRILWFVLIGWWLSALWLAIAWALNVSIIGMVVGFWMFDRTPAIVSLAR